MIMGNTPKVDIGRARASRHESAAQPQVIEYLCSR